MTETKNIISQRYNKNIVIATTTKHTYNEFLSDINKKNKYKIVFDNGKPYEETANNNEELKSKLKDFYESNKDSDDYFNSWVYNENGENISDSQFIAEIIDDILNESESEVLN